VARREITNLSVWRSRCDVIDSNRRPPSNELTGWIKNKASVIDLETKQFLS